MANLESVLVADDDEEDLRLSVDVLTEDGFNVSQAHSGTQAVDLIKEKKFDLIITDIVMPGVTGYSVIQAALEANPDAICIAMTSFGSLDSAIEALRFGAYSFLTKPCDATEFRHCVNRGLEKQRLTKELRQRNMALEKLNRELDQKIQEATAELREINHRVLNEMASLQEVDRLKSAFLDNVTHDLRSPITTMQAYMDLVGEDESEKLTAEEKKSCLRSMRKSVEHMNYLIGQLVEAAQLKSGKIKLNLQMFPVSEVLEESAALARAQAQAKNISLEVQKNGTASVMLGADRGRLLQIMSNLLGNACKFTPQNGKIVLAAKSEGSFMHFSVADTGPGIAPEYHKRIFERFYQVDATNVSEFKGLGLGLGIARDLVELHHGKIWVESTVGEGSQFHVSIPTQQA